MSGNENDSILDIVGMSEVFSAVKTEENCSFNISAFTLGSEWIMPFLLSGEIPLLSHLLDFT